MVDQCNEVACQTSDSQLNRDDSSLVNSAQRQRKQRNYNTCIVLGSMTGENSDVVEGSRS